jgi:NADP-dependent alcohol dehydrogenase
VTSVVHLELPEGARLLAIYGGGSIKRNGVYDQAIGRTRAFFESVGVKTHLKDYGVAPEVVQSVSQRLAARGWTTLGEWRDIGPKEVEAILSNSL